MIGVFDERRNFIMRNKMDLGVLRDDVVRELNSRGFNAVPMDKNEGFAVFHGIAEKSDPVTTPVLYMEKLGDGEKYADVDEWTDAFATAFNMFDDSYSFFTDGLSDPDFILKNADVRLGRPLNDGTVGRGCPLKGLETALYVSTVNPENPDNILSVALRPGILSKAGLCENDVWRAAQERMENDVFVASLSEVMGVSSGIGGGLFPPILVVTNGFGRYGASRLLTRKAMSEVENRLRTDRFAVLPSSKHEVLVLPDGVFDAVDDMSLMVSSINSEKVAPEDRLSDEAFIMNVQDVLNGIG